MAGVCPFLGLLDDAETRVVYPSTANCCHRANPPAYVLPEHQSLHCLNSHHRTCSVFLSGAGKPLPEEFGGKQPLAGLKKAGVVGMLLGAFVVAALLFWQVASLPAVQSAFGAAGQQGARFPTSTPAGQLFWQALAATRVAELRESVYLPGVFADLEGRKIAIEPPRSRETPTAAFIPPSQEVTEEPMLALQSTATLPPEVQPTQCQPRTAWPIYVVKQGDTLSQIARQVGASVAQLIEANCLKNDVIRTGQQLFVPNLPKPTAKPTKEAQATATVGPPPPPTDTPEPPPTAIPPPPTETASP
jgi:LysM repeat protein